MTSRPIWQYLAPSLLVLCTLLAAGSFYLEPKRPAAAVVVLLLVAGMTLVLLLVPRRANGEAARRRAEDGIRNGIVFACPIVATALGAKLAAGYGLAHGADISWRATMALIAAFIVFTGNTIPKTLSPLSSRECDAARVQSLQRFAGWTWVLTGLVLALAALVLPVQVAEALSFVLLPGAILIVAAQLFRLRRTRQGAA